MRKMVMSFQNQQVLNFLLSNGFVYTFRKKQKAHVGKDWINAGRGLPKIADVSVYFVRKIRKAEELIPYVEHSGFGHLWDWLSAIKELNPNMEKVEGFLYRVTIRG